MDRRDDWRPHREASRQPGQARPNGQFRPPTIGAASTPKDGDGRSNNPKSPARHSRFDWQSISRSMQSIRPHGHTDEDLEAQEYRRDAWDREWSTWSRESAAYEAVGWDDVDDFAPSRGREAWGELPEYNTIASVAVQAAPRYARRRSVGDQSGTTQLSWRTFPSEVVPAFAALIDWIRSGFDQNATPPRQVINVLLITSILGIIVLGGAGTGLAAYSDYTRVYSLAKGGLAAFKNVPADLGIKNGGSTHKAGAAELQAATTDINTAYDDFSQLNAMLSQPDPILKLAAKVPSLRAKFTSALVLSEVAVQAAKVAQVMLPGLAPLASVLATSPLTAASTATNAPLTPLLSQSDLNALTTALDNAKPLIDQLIAKVVVTPYAELTGALSASQKATFGKYLQYLPNIGTALNLLQQMEPVLPNLLGIEKAKTYLLMTLDSSEVRPVGGFQGQFAFINVNGGHVGPISLRDIYQIEPLERCSACIPYPALTYGDGVIPNYFWIANTFGPSLALRNSGLSPDFAQSAEYALQQLDYTSQAFHGKLADYSTTTGLRTGSEPAPASFDGVIAFQSTLIAQVIGVTGPVVIGAPYNVTVTSANLTQEIHTFQETTAGRNLGNGVAGGSDAAKKFTALLSTAVLAKVKAMPKEHLFDLAALFFSDLHTKDIQMYFRDTKVEDALRSYQVSSEIYTGPGDSLAINEANLTGDKINQYLEEDVTDKISLSKKGTATHQLQINYKFNIPAITYDPTANNYGQNGPDPTSAFAKVYNVIYNAGYNAIHSQYRRIYVAPNAVLNYNSGGFAGPLLAGNPTSASTIVNPGWYSYPNYYNPYYPASTSYAGLDVSNRSIISGYYNYEWVANADGTITWQAPDDQPIVSVSWFVPSAVQNGQYSLHLQRQSGVNMVDNVTITSACPGTSAVSFNKPLTTDVVLALPVPKC